MPRRQTIIDSSDREEEQLEEEEQRCRGAFVNDVWKALWHLLLVRRVVQVRRMQLEEKQEEADWLVRLSVSPRGVGEAQELG